ncbi:unnamed protein product [Rotaria sordida]|uniref:F-box domain-containing protein n=1 Tax=Rotaria sordida TaxID=392033 RepID=A0A815IH36_9BILA|nr:unnamed protein product [Rotaria sordida]
MKRAKQQDNDLVQFLNINKKRKLENQIISINSNKSDRVYIFEDLANEILYEIFEYLDVYDIYKGFYNLNKRFQNLAINSNVLTKINISTISKSNFEDYYRNILIPNRNRIKFLRLSNPFTADIIFSPPRTLLNFIDLEILILDNVQIKYLNKISRHLIELPKLHSLTISLIGYNQALNILFLNIFHLPKLKYCKIEYQTKDYDYELFQLYLTQLDSSPIECLIVNGRFPFNAFHNLLCCVSKLQHLTINSLCFSFHFVEQEKLSYIDLKYLKHVSIKLDLISFYELESIIKKFFYHVQVLRFTTRIDEDYLNAKRWQKLIISYMPSLPIFDINHKDFIKNNNLTYHNMIHQFNSSFWIEKRWFFTHQHYWKSKLNRGIFYSTASYRRKDYRYYCQSVNPICSNIQKENLNSVKHFYIVSKEIEHNGVNYFPNVKTLSIKNEFIKSNNSIIATLHRMIPLIQLTKLVIECWIFPIKNIINLLYFTPNVHTLSLSLLLLDNVNKNSKKENEIFQNVSKKNKIQKLILNWKRSLSDIQFVVNVFPRLKYLKVDMNRKEIGQTIRFLLSKTHNKTRNLCYLCIMKVPKVCLKQTQILIKSENLLNNYSIKYINNDLHLWW